MTTPDQIKWGHYRDYEGPFYRGNQPYVLPPNPSLEQRYLDVITATEGGTYNAINMYDRCGVSVGLIQWCEFGQFSVSALLGAVSEELEEPLRFPDDANYRLARLPDGRWRFFSLKDGAVDTIDRQRRMFFLNAKGTLGSWDVESIAHAKTWAAALATLFEDEAAQRVQTKFTTNRLDGFVQKAARSVWTSTQSPALQTAWGFASYAAYLSFAANNPTIASNMLQAYSKEHGVHPTDRDWVIGLLKQLTFGPNFSIYPARYNAIRPRLEKNFGVDLPDFYSELRVWQREIGIDPADPESHRLDTTKAVQEALNALGFDLGPAGADGIFGKKTREAVIAFQRQNGLQVDGIVGKHTRWELHAALESLGL
jgi:N-acetylmuramoyl-L-alanine amidase/peptidoglycan L-alanyl-D-glutamate endopeptidase CwlK